ncbi:MAG TPA: hypothetical protein VKT30_05715 [Caulobacteraceae bacterium]|nr:hypothetical protein [Caulobacteraceae bacterium]
MWKKKKLAARSLDHLQDAADAIADDLRAEVSGRLKDAFGRANDAYDRTRGRAMDAAESANGFVRDKALMLVGIAAGTALLTGLLMGGRRHASAAEHPTSVGL